MIKFEVLDETDPTRKLEGKELEKAVEEDLRQFEMWFCEYVDASPGLSYIEISILKSYAWFKTHPGEIPSGTK